jgi:pimeloyl-ACP methyl ester carboxylesterase
VVGVSGDSEQGRCLAPDLAGMGQSGKSPTNAYRFVDHARYLDAWFEALNLTSKRHPGHTRLGIGLGFHRATRYPEQIKAIAYIEAIVPLRVSRPTLQRSSRVMEKRCLRVRCPSSSSWANPAPSSRVAFSKFCQTWRNQTEVTVKGLHFLQEDSPDEIGRALQAFVKSVR